MGVRPSRYDALGAGGRNRVWLNGRFITGPDYRGTIFTLLLIAVLALIAFIVTFPFLVVEWSAAGIPLLAITVVSLVIAFWSCWLAATTDPGIIPRTAAPSPLTPPPPPQSNRRDRIIVLRGRTVVVKYCETCRIWRPPRTSHCATCNNCVQRFDHHCPWLGNDIGLRNYRSYFTFVSSATVASVAVITAAVLHLVRKTDIFREREGISHVAALHKTFTDGATALNIPLILITALGLAFTGGLTGFHLYLMTSNVTTAESFKKSARNSSHEHDDYRGLRAVFYLQCTTRPPSAVSQGFAYPPYEDHDEIATLISEQIEDERLAQMGNSTSMNSIYDPEQLQESNSGARVALFQSLGRPPPSLNNV